MTVTFIGISRYARRYPTTLMVEARVLAEGGWNRAEIRRVLQERHGVAPDRETIKRWCSPSYSDRINAVRRPGAVRRRSKQWNFRLGGGRVTKEYQLAFMHRLEDAGVSHDAIGKVCGVVLDRPLTKWQVRYALIRDDDDAKAA